MKKILGLILIGAATLALTGCGNGNSNENTTGPIIETDAALFEELRNNDEISLIYVGRPTCPACNRFYPVIEEVGLEFDLEFFYTNLDNWNVNDISTILFPVMEEFVGTPTLFIMQDGEEVDVLIGYHSRSELISFLERNNIINE